MIIIIYQCPVCKTINVSDYCPNQACDHYGSMIELHFFSQSQEETTEQ